MRIYDTLHRSLPLDSVSISPFYIPYRYPLASAIAAVLGAAVYLSSLVSLPLILLKNMRESETAMMDVTGFLCESLGSNIEASESHKSPSQPIGWNPGRRQWKMTIDNSKIEISETRAKNVEKSNIRRVGVHSDGGRSQERIGDDNQFSDKLRGR
jgi:hypothetical protein